MSRTVFCRKYQKELEGLPAPPYPGPRGKDIFEHVSRQAWQDWLKHQTLLIKEKRLNLMDPKARKYLAEQMDRHFFGAGADAATGYTPPAQ